MTPTSVTEEELYNLGRWLVGSNMLLPDLSNNEKSHVLRGLWDRAGFVGRNNGGYPVASVLVHWGLAEQIADVVEEVTGRRSPARPVGAAHWVGVSGARCGPWLRYLYACASVVSPVRARQVRTLLAEMH